MRCLQTLIDLYRVGYVTLILGTVNPMAPFLHEYVVELAERQARVREIFRRARATFST